VKILFCVSHEWSRELGASKVTVELAEELERSGWSYDQVSLPDLVGKGKAGDPVTLAEGLRGYLRAHASQYDVVDYDHQYLPYPRTEFPERTLLVARSVLLRLHFVNVRFPEPRSVRTRIGTILHGRARARELALRVELARRTVTEADLVNVSNDDDRLALLARGVGEDRIVVLPFGLTEDAQSRFGSCSTDPPELPVIGFVGTFDPRKGAADFPHLVERVLGAVPEARFLLVGTRGLHSSAEDVLRAFPAARRPQIDVVHGYRPEQLPALLGRCSVGVFPSYLEGFGFGVLEMLAAAVPVVAYRAPGAPMMLTDPYLVPVGDWAAMADNVVRLLRGPDELRVAREWARSRAQEFSWRSVAERTGRIYEAALTELRGRGSSRPAPLRLS
jgi:glycosyltransferase involved in cell wall biosynthesis